MKSKVMGIGLAVALLAVPVAGYASAASDAAAARQAERQAAAAARQSERQAAASARQEARQTAASNAQDAHQERVANRQENRQEARSTHQENVADRREDRQEARSERAEDRQEARAERQADRKEAALARVAAARTRVEERYQKRVAHINEIKTAAQTAGNQEAVQRCDKLLTQAGEVRDRHLARLTEMEKKINERASSASSTPAATTGGAQ